MAEKLTGARGEPVPDCPKCAGNGWYWRVPDGFNPFYAGGYATALAMFKASCLCSEARFGRAVLTQTQDTHEE